MDWITYCLRVLSTRVDIRPSPILYPYSPYLTVTSWNCNLLPRGFPPEAVPGRQDPGIL